MASRIALARRFLLLGLAALLALREVLHLTEPFFHNDIDTFLDIFCAICIVLIVANAFNFRAISWSRTVAPCLAALAAISIVTPFTQTPGYRMAAWAETSPWRGYLPRPFFIDIDPWLSLAADLLVFTTLFSVVTIVIAVIRSKRALHAKAI